MIDLIAIIQDPNKTDADKIQAIESGGYDLNAVDANNGNSSMLRTVTLNGGLVLFQWLLQKNPSLINAQSSANTNVFFYALKYANKEIINYILSNHAHLITEINKNGQNAFHFASMGNNDLSVYEQLERFNISSNTSDKSGVSPIHFAAKNGSIHALTYLIRAYGKYCCFTPEDNESGVTPFMVAAQYNQLAFVKAVLAQFADSSAKGMLMAQKSRNGCNLAHVAAEGDCVFLLEQMYELDMSLEHPDNLGWRPMHIAAKCGSIHAFAYLVKIYGINCYKASRHNEFEHSLLSVAAKNNQFVFVEEILAQLEYLNKKIMLMAKKHKKGHTLAHAAAQRDCVPLLERMYELNIPLDEPDDSGWSPIHYAAQYGSIQALAYFIKIYGIDYCKQANEHGDTPFAIACNHNQSAFVDDLVKQIAFHKREHSSEHDQEVAVIETSCTDTVVSTGNSSSETPLSAVSSGHSVFSTSTKQKKRSNASDHTNGEIKKQCTNSGVSGGSSSSVHSIFSPVNIQATNLIEPSQLRRTP